MTPNRLRNTLEIKGRHFDTPSLRSAITAPLGMGWYIQVWSVNISPFTISSTVRTKQAVGRNICLARTCFKLSLKSLKTKLQNMVLHSASSN